MILGKNFSNLKVILVEPSGPLNVGSVARLCSNFEVDELRIVSPKCDIFSLEAKKMALKGQKFLKHCKVFEDIFDWTLTFKNINNLAIIFGREDRGLTNSELLLANKTFNIPTSQNNPSLNLSHAVSIVLYELNKSSKKNINNELKVFNLASSKEVHDTFVEIEEMLLRVGYLLKHTSKAKISKFKNFILRANTSMHEVNVLRGIVHQINWFLNNSKNK
jgi:tRNA/rRNA methyltransferase